MEWRIGVGIVLLLMFACWVAIDARQRRRGAAEIADGRRSDGANNEPPSTGSTEED